MTHQRLPTTYSPTFSFCIPTRNRAGFITKCLDSIVAQTRDDLEIVVVDGASTDNTKEIVESYRGQFSRLRYVCRDECVGVDRDILLAVELAQGEYCWLMSDDDRLEPDALDYVREVLREHGSLTGISVNINAYDRNLEYKIRAVPSISGDSLKVDHLFIDREQCFSMLGVHFGFLSGQIVKRRKWELAIRGHSLDEFCNAWLLVYVIGRMLECDSPRWLYIHKRLVAYRSGNDSFMSRLGIYRRQEITHVAFEFTVRSLFGRRSTVYDAVFHTILSDRMARSLAVIKAAGCDYRTQGKLLSLYTRQYWYFPLFWLKVFPLFLIPNFLFRMVRAGYFFAMAQREQRKRNNIHNPTREIN